MNYYYRFVNWCRWVIFKRRRTFGLEIGHNGRAFWTLIEYDGRRGTYTVLDEGWCE